MPNKRTGQDYLEAEMKKRNAEQHKKYSEKHLRNAVLKGKPGKMKPIGPYKGEKAKLTPLKKKKK